ncbi:PREDICTED: formin-like protein 4 [Tarenaya hassleriana]|uniref:formin-like protein 4 n=1 Tax=Tarenaya hassleriana TaxID=28532 RepID=UPI00053CA78F|nr:PREDICTED: formin-like protein 4 [Tarenaya hassleriana]
MAAIFLQPWPFLLHLTIVFFFCISLLPSPSFSQSDSPQNLETFFPDDALAPPPPPQPNLRSPSAPSPPQKSSSNRAAITRAVLITAASTAVVAAVFFFLFQRFVVARRRRDRVAAESAVRPGPPPPEAALAREGLTRFDRNVKGLIVDEDGLDVLYWKKLQRGQSGSLRKEVMNREGEEGEDKKVIYYKNKKKSEPVSEIPLLRGKSSTSHSVIHHENYRDNSTRPSPPVKFKSLSFNTVDSSETESSPPPPPPPSPLPMPAKRGSSAPAPPPPPPLPIPVKQDSPANAPPPPPPLPIPVKRDSPLPAPPPPPPLPIPVKRDSPLPVPPSTVSSKPPPAPKGSSAEEGSSNGQVKLKPLHWDKVNPDSDHSMVWDKIDRGSFRFDGDLMEALFGYVAKKSPESDGDKKQSSSSPSQIFILDPRKSQNTAIVIKSLGITQEELVHALTEGQDFVPDTLERLARIAPTKEEQSAILDFDGDSKKLADAESFLFHLLRAVPSAFTRLNALLFKANYYPEIAHHKQCLQTLDAACRGLRAHGLFVKLLEAILKAGNRMNAGTTRGNAQAFNLTALLKLSDVKSVDGKTTLLHFVVEEVVRSEGKRCLMNKRNRNLSSSSNNGGSSSESSQAVSKEEQEKEYLKLGLPIVGGLSSEFTSVKKAAGIDYDAVTATCSALMTRAKDTRRVLAQCEGGGFVKKMNGFLDSVEEETRMAREEERKVMEFVKRTTEYYQAGALKGKNPFQIFVIIRDFLGMVDKVCIEIARNLQRRKTGKTGSTPLRNAVKFPVLPPNFMSDRSRSDSGGSDSDQ